MSRALTIDSSMSTVRTTPLLLRLVHLDVRYEKQIHIQAFNLRQFQMSNKNYLKERKEKGVNKINDPKPEHTSALLSAFLSKSRMNFVDLTGQRPCPLE